MSAHREPAHIHRVRAGGPLRGVTTPVPRVYLPVLLTTPDPSGSARPTRLCRGCSHPPRRPPARTASSFTRPLRRPSDGRSFTSIRYYISASWRSGKWARSSFHVPSTVDTASADITIARVHQVCPAGRGPRGLLVSPYPHRGTGKCCAPTTTPGDREHDLLGCGESLWRPTALMDLMRSGSDGGPARNGDAPGPGGKR